MAEKALPSLKELQEIRCNLEEFLKSVKKTSDPSIGLKEAISLLKTLQDLPVNLELLQASGIGIIVNDLRKKWDNEDVKTLGKSLIKKWKKVLKNEETKDQLDVGDSLEPTYKVEQETGEKRPSLKLKLKISKIVGSYGQSTVKKLKISEGRNSDHETSLGRSWESDEDKPGKSSTLVEAIRSKCRELLLRAIEGEGAEEVDVHELVERLEECIYRSVKKETGFKYKSRVNSRVANLKNPKNAALKAMFLAGEITPEKLASMSVEDMACDELKALRAQFRQEGMSKALMVTDSSGTKSDLLKCGKCGARDCVYSQMQTRSSDEPMTTFVLCNACGNRWKF